MLANKLCILLLTFIFANQVLAEGQRDANVANLFHNEQRTFHCERSQRLLQNFEGMNDSEILQRLNDEIDTLDLLIQSENFNFSERRMLKQNRRIIRCNFSSILCRYS